MNSATLPSFWQGYEKLTPEVKKAARKSFELWQQNPFHPSLHFKCINREENIWSVRVNTGYRALGIFENSTVTWFWIGNHKQYERFFG